MQQYHKKVILISVWGVLAFSLNGCGGPPATDARAVPLLGVSSHLASHSADPDDTEMPDAIARDSGVDSATPTLNEDTGDTGAMDSAQLVAPVALSDTPMTGPLKNVSEFCRQLKVDGRGSCIKRNADMQLAKKEGRRGDVLEASVLRYMLLGAKDDEGDTGCALLIKTAAGWWASVDALPCAQSNDERLPVLTMEMAQLRFADELGEGVVLAERSRAYPLEVDVDMGAKKWKGEKQVSASERKYCAVREGLPVCTDWLTTWIDGDGIDVRHQNGEIVIRRIRGKGAASLWQPGRYRIFPPMSLTPAFSDAQLPSDVFDLNEEAPIVAGRLFGPFDSVAHYCDAPPTFEDEAVAMEIAPIKKACPMKTGNWRRSISIKSDTMRSARLFMRSDELAGAAIAYCDVAIKTKAGWYVHRTTEHCEGVIGPGHWISRKVLETRVDDDGDGAILEIVFEQTDKRIEYRQREFEIFDPWSENGEALPPPFTLAGWGPSAVKSKKRRKGPSRQPVTVFTRSVYLIMCKMGSTGLPGCTGEIYLGCGAKKNPLGDLQKWQVQNNTLRIEKRADASGDSSDEMSPGAGCGIANEVPEGTYPLVFP